MHDHDKEMDREKGAFKDFGGKVEEAAGNLTGDTEMQARGSEKQAEGKAQNLWGKTKDAAGNLVDDVKDAFDPNSKDPNTRDYDRS
jgi:uncharacterized protein YjbJ (UPF0337 family)